MDEVVELYQGAEEYVRAFYEATKDMSDVERESFRVNEWIE